MPKLDKKIGFIGAGNMGEAFIGAIIKADVFSPAMIYACDAKKERLDFLTRVYGISVFDDNFKLFSASDVIILAVKPQQIDEVLLQIASNRGYEIFSRKIIISIAAGFSIKKIEDLLYTPLDENAKKKIPVIRVMPNTPALVCAGIAGMSANKNVVSEDLDIARTILEATGEVIEFKEEDLDAVTAVSGSGPAYIFYLVEAMIQGGVDLGLDLEDVASLTMATLRGAASLLEEMKESPEVLRRKVTSPGGTTEAAIKVLDDNRVKQHIVKALDAAARRSKELGK